MLAPLTQALTDLRSATAPPEVWADVAHRLHLIADAAAIHALSDPHLVEAWVRRQPIPAGPVRPRILEVTPQG